MIDATVNRPADAPPMSWVDVYAPPRWRPYLRLARADRPIGTWLLFWPCAFSAVIVTTQGGHWWITLWHLLLFLVGAAAMRGAGCTYNDIVDRDLDARVARTAGRPIPAGQVTVTEAVAFLAAQLLLGLIVLLQFNSFTVVLGLASLIPIAIYPFMKRITDWPQVVLGLAFNWGALVGWSSVTGGLALAPLLLYLGCWAWTMGYDTIYAHQDKEDDALVSIGSTALALGEWTKQALWGFYGLATFSFAMAMAVCGYGWPFVLLLSVPALHLGRQIVRVRLNDPDNCLAVFRSNRDTGLLFFLVLCVGALFT